MPEHRGNLTDCATPIDGTRLADHDASLCNNETLVSGWLELSASACLSWSAPAGLGSPNMLANTALTAGAVVVAGVCAFLCIDDLSGDGAGGAKKRKSADTLSSAPIRQRAAAAAYSVAWHCSQRRGRLSVCE
jgi:hypothetical protein